LTDGVEIQNSAEAMPVGGDGGIRLDRKMAILKACLLLLCLASLATITNLEKVKTWMICVGFGVLFFLIDVIYDIITLVRTQFQIRHWWKEREAVTWNVLSRMPWKIVPFVFSMFIIVELLSKYGLITLFAEALCKMFAATTYTSSSSVTLGQKLISISVTVFTISVLSFVACNVMNNQPMTILFTTLFHDQSMQQLFLNAHKSIQQGAMLSLVVGSNLGANFTLIGALAGLLWIGILRDLDSVKGMSSFKFMKYGLCVTPVVIILVSLTLIAELMIFG